MSTKATYKDATRKKAVRKFLFSFFNEKNIVGLAGPDIKEYISWCKENGIDNIELWENDTNVMFDQLSKIPKNAKVSYNFGDIINAESSKDKVYDFDYCTTIVTLHDHIKRFKTEKFVMTFCTRKVGNKVTIDEFFYGRREKITTMIEKRSPLPHWSIKTVFGEYIAAPYFDTTPMLCIAKVK